MFRLVLANLLGLKATVTKNLGCFCYSLDFDSDDEYMIHLLIAILYILIVIVTTCFV